MGKRKEKCLTKKMGICAFERWEAIFLMGTCVCVVLCCVV